MPAGLLGVGEPLVYGVSLPLGRPFVTACVGGAFGGGVVGLLGQFFTPVGATAVGPSGWALFPLLAGGRGLATAAACYAAGLLAGYAVGFVATYAFGFTARMLAEHNTGDAETRREVSAAAPAAARNAAPPDPTPHG